MLSLLDVVKRTTEFFEKRGVECARLDAELIVAHALGLNRMQVYLQFERLLDEARLAAIRAMVRRRGRREPLAYVLGTAAFGDLELHVDARVLVPRPETEQLAALVQDELEAPPRSILDLGTGSGALALALARMYPEARATGVDASEDALEVARANAERSGLGGRVVLRRSDWYGALGPRERFDLVVANPPYLTEEEWAAAPPEVRDFEPKAALVAGDGGCADLLAVIAGAPARLEPGGRLFLETGIAQHPRLLAACAAAGLAGARSENDWAGRPRFVAARAPEAGG
jgi:release factor glutamine methyltransferase